MELMMIKKTKMRLVLLLFLFLLSFTATVDVHLDPPFFKTQVLPNVKSKTTECCDKCICTKSNPPQCHCDDKLKLETCFTTCKKCVCSFSFTPVCGCYDTKDSCYEPCN